MNLFKSIISLQLLLFVTITHAQMTETAKVDDTAAKINWGYKGNVDPQRWGLLSPQFSLCMTGKEQSPISIPNKLYKAQHTLSINYNLAPFDIIRDGTTSLFMQNKRIIVKDGHSVQINFDDDTRETIRFNNVNYRLIQFHIHTPSENELQGQGFPLEIHFVHQSDDGQVAVIAVFAKGGPENSEIQKIIVNMPADIGVEHEVDGVTSNPAALLPSDRRYYNFAGSLTTPPCTEGLQWIVMSTPITVSPAQIALLKKAAGGANARPVQPLNNRKVRFTISQ